MFFIYYYIYYYSLCGNKLRLINHASNEMENAEVFIKFVQNQLRIYLYAKSRINIG